MLATFSFTLEISSDLKPQDGELIRLCLEGFKKGVHITCLFGLETEKSAYVNALTKFTYLMNLREMSNKNVKSIEALISIAGKDGDYVGSNWFPILKAVSQLEKMHLISSGAPTESPFDNDPATQRHKSLSEQKEVGSRGAVSLESMIDFSKTEITNSRVLDQLMDLQEVIDNLFNVSANLSSDSLVHFIRELCNVSKEEIALPNPRIFSLQKLIEVASFNTDRIRYVWSRIWPILSCHFAFVATNKLKTISIVGIDALRQLSEKLLTKQELAHYHFQKDYVHPFDTIISQVDHFESKELVLRSIHRMVMNLSGSIKGGWGSIFHILQTVAYGNDLSLTEMGAEVMQTIFRESIELVPDSEFFAVIKSVGAYILRSNVEGASLAVIKCFIKLAEILEERYETIEKSFRMDKDRILNDHELKKVVLEILSEGRDQEDLFSDFFTPKLLFWIPLLKPLVDSVVKYPQESIQASCLFTIFELFTKHGTLFTHEEFNFIIDSTLFTILRSSREIMEKQSTMVNKKDILQILTTSFTKELIHLPWDVVFHTVPIYLDILANYITSNTQMLISLGFKSMLTFCDFYPEITSEERGISEDDSVKVIVAFSSVLGNLLVSTNPEGVFTVLDNDREHTEEFSVIRNKSSAHLLVLRVVEKLLRTSETLGKEAEENILDGLGKSYRFAERFDGDIELRERLRQFGFLNRVPNLLKQEIHSLSIENEILFSSYTLTSSDTTDSYFQRLSENVNTILRSYVDRSGDETLQTSMWEKPVLMVLDALGSLDNEKFEYFIRNSTGTYPSMLELTLSRDDDVRTKCYSLLTRVNEMLLKLF